MNDSSENELRIQSPVNALQADYQSSRKAAIRLFCLSCMGGESDAKTEVSQCAAKDCPLWRYRLGGSPLSPPTGFIPERKVLLQAQRTKSSNSKHKLYLSLLDKTQEGSEESNEEKKEYRTPKEYHQATGRRFRINDEEKALFGDSPEARQKAFEYRLHQGAL